LQRNTFYKSSAEEIYMENLECVRDCCSPEHQEVVKHAFYLVWQLKAMKKKSASSEMCMNVKQITVFDIHKIF
jgi:hypothetical protein